MSVPSDFSQPRVPIPAREHDDDIDRGNVKHHDDVNAKRCDGLCALTPIAMSSTFSAGLRVTTAGWQADMPVACGTLQRAQARQSYPHSTLCTTLTRSESTASPFRSMTL